MLPNRYHLFAELLNLTHEEFENFSMRFAQFLHKRAPTKKNVMEGMFIYREIIDEKRGRQHIENKTIKFGRTKHVQLKKHALLILKKREEENWGAQRISTYLKATHGATVNKGTIRYFLELNNG